MSAEMDYYAVLGVDPDADPDEVRRAFRERVRACHPDRVANLDADLRRLAEEKMVQLNEAYAVLRNPARRSAYDESRRRRATAESTIPVHDGWGSDRSPGRTAGPRVTDPHPLPGDDSGAPEAAARNRMGDRDFVARAASEEFETRLRHALVSHGSWTPVAVSGATLALRGARGLNEHTFVMLAAPRLDEKLLRRFLRRLQAYAAGLSNGWFRRGRVFGFVGAVEFSTPDRLRRSIEQFNAQSQRNGGRLAEATLVDLVTWKVVPGDTDLQARLKALTR